MFKGELLATPKKYQAKGVKKILKKFKGRALLADDMGLGKSLQAIMVMIKLKQKVVITCPASLKYNWVDELLKFLPSETPFICSGQKPQRELIKANIIICNYEILNHWKKCIKDSGVNLFIADESQCLKNGKAIRTKAAQYLCDNVDYRLLLSGTPIENNPAELFSQLKMIDKSLFPSYILFIKRYNGARKSMFGWQLHTATNTKELHKILKTNCMVRRKKCDVLKELPAKVRQVINVDIANRKEYDDAEKNIIKWIRRNTDLNIKKAKKNKELAKLDKLKYIAAKGKLKVFCEWVNNQSPKEKLIVFCYNKKIVEAMALKLNDCVLVDSSKSSEERQVLVQRFQNDDSIRVFLTTIRVGGTGLTLTAASTTVFFQLDWNASRHDQAEDRVHRIGQTASSCNAIYFIARNTIEEKIIKLIDARRKSTSAIIDGEEVSKDELLTELMKELKE